MQDIASNMETDVAFKPESVILHDNSPGLAARLSKLQWKLIRATPQTERVALSREGGVKGCEIWAPVGGGVVI